MKTKITAFIILLFAVFLNYGCSTKNKAIKYFNTHPEIASEFCGDKFPPKTEYRLGKTITKSDTVFKEGKTIPCPDPVQLPDGKLIPGSVKCPGEKIIRDTVFRVDTIYQENTARLTDLQYKLIKSEIENKQLESDKKRLLSSVVILGLILLVATFLTLKK